MMRARPVVGLVVLLYLAAACSSASTSVTAVSASNRIAGELRLPDEVKPCLVSTFDSMPQARAALDPDKAPSDEDLDALSAVIATCVPPPTFAASVSPQMAAGYRAVADIPPDKEQCLRDRMTQLSDDDRGLLVTGPVSRLRDPGSERSLAVNDVLRRLLDACGIELTGSPSPSDTPP
jgi:hypothetical protein